MAALYGGGYGAGAGVGGAPGYAYGGYGTAAPLATATAGGSGGGGGGDDPSVEITSLKPDCVQFVLRNTDHGLANALRRVLIADVPTLGPCECAARVAVARTTRLTGGGLPPSLRGSTQRSTW